MNIAIPLNAKWDDKAHDVQKLSLALNDLDPRQAAAEWLKQLINAGLDHIPLPGSGSTLQRWQALSTIAQYDLSLVKLFEGHTDALAIMREFGVSSGRGSIWGIWAAESPNCKVVIEVNRNGEYCLQGTKRWCSGAAHVSHGLLTAWFSDGRGPQLVRVDMNQEGIHLATDTWCAIGMANSGSIDVNFNGAVVELVGGLGEYLTRPGFWHGGAGIAACWYGGALSIASALHDSVNPVREAGRAPFNLIALGKVDLHLQNTLSILRATAQFIDNNPLHNIEALALRARLSAERSAACVLDEVGRVLGATPFCKSAKFAQFAADLPVFIRQSHADKDFAALGRRVMCQDKCDWNL